ncbi:Altered inheritance rate of mitochondria protein 25 [Nymphaea thermarum]|nr:Altered inheritance rate of mitochondria protein 25 [Nymphaea thermarum]
MLVMVSILEDFVLRRSPFTGDGAGKFGSLEQKSQVGIREFSKFAKWESPLTRDRLVQLWLMDRREERDRKKRKQKVFGSGPIEGNVFGSPSTFGFPFKRLFPGIPGVVDDSLSKESTPPVQPPLSQTGTYFLEPTSAEEVKVEPLLARANLLITRDIEWANLMLGFEQENRYAVVDPAYPQSPAGYIREQSNIIFRQLLRTRRPFIAYITDAQGNELFQVRRPPWLINSTIYAEINGKEIGVVHRRWHLWRRIYDLYLGKEQFAVVENPGFWNWTFTLKDNEGKVLAEIDRDWRGIGLELFTDAGQYVIRFGHSNDNVKAGPVSQIHELEITRPLTLSERAVAVALAVSLDNDYFSRHSGWGIPFIPIAGDE